MHEAPDFDGAERRALTPDRVALMIEEALEERISKMESRMLAHMDLKFGQFHKLFTDHVEEAFPPGPLLKHRMDHEGRIRAAATREKIRDDLWAWGIKGAVGLMLFLFAMGALEWIKREISK